MEGKNCICKSPMYTANDSLILDIKDQAAFSWIVNDWSSRNPPHWFIGMMYLNNFADSIRPDRYRLYFLKVAIEQNKFPLIESFISVDHDSDRSDYIFFKGYWEYFWWFLETKGLNAKVYNSVRQLNQMESETENMLWKKLLTDVTHESLEDLNKEFINFIKSRNIENIPQIKRHWELVGKNFVMK